MTNKLKPCPFCGGKAVLWSDFDLCVTTWYVACSQCGVQTKRTDSEDLCSERWNRRVEHGEG